MQKKTKLDWSMIGVILTLAWPTMLEQLMQTAVQYIDTAMVGSLGTYATAAVGATTTVNWLVNSTVSALSIGFLLLRIPYAVGLALLVAVIDIMPILGTGTVLIPWAIVAAVLYLGSVLGAFKLGKSADAKADLKPFLLVSVGAAALVILLAATLFPNLVPATDPFFSLTIANSAATDATLLPMTIIAVIGVPLVLVYHVIIYRSFRGRVK